MVMLRAVQRNIVIVPIWIEGQPYFFTTFPENPFNDIFLNDTHAEDICYGGTEHRQILEKYYMVLNAALFLLILVSNK